jgi:hypothetical protein
VPLSEINQANENKQESQDVEMAPEQLDLIDENNSSRITLFPIKNYYIFLIENIIYRSSADEIHKRTS